MKTKIAFLLIFCGSLRINLYSQTVSIDNFYVDGNKAIIEITLNSNKKITISQTDFCNAEFASLFTGEKHQYTYWYKYVELDDENCKLVISNYPIAELELKDVHAGYKVSYELWSKNKMEFQGKTTFSVEVPNDDKKHIKEAELFFAYDIKDKRKKHIRSASDYAKYKVISCSY